MTIQPVLNMQRGDAVDGHHLPPWMRDLVILRDGHCVFRGCTKHARGCDLDHITPYDPTGPPGQTRPDNLACLCRRHHRAKTTGLWRYTRTPAGSYLWHGPHGTSHVVQP
jgi:5-methylcytosine-specific restriction endonuclease McrA